MLKKTQPVFGGGGIRWLWIFIPTPTMIGRVTQLKILNFCLSFLTGEVGPS